MKNLICIICPRGCHLQVDDNNNVTGNSCNRGKVYAIQELTSPTRIVTSTIKVLGGNLKRVSVKTNKPIPKDKIFEVMKEIDKTKLSAPVAIGEVLISNVLGLNSDVVATREIKAIK